MTLLLVDITERLIGCLHDMSVKNGYLVNDQQRTGIEELRCDISFRHDTHGILSDADRCLSAAMIRVFIWMKSGTYTACGSCQGYLVLGSDNSKDEMQIEGLASPTTDMKTNEQSQVVVDILTDSLYNSPLLRILLCMVFSDISLK